jgi:phosphoglycerate kinase
MGYFEDGKHDAGTKALIESISKSNAYKVAGGGDTEAAMTQFKTNQEKVFNHVSSGGGALLHYLAYGTLPAIEVVG